MKEPALQTSSQVLFCSLKFEKIQVKYKEKIEKFSYLKHDQGQAVAAGPLRLALGSAGQKDRLLTPIAVCKLHCKKGTWVYCSLFPTMIIISLTLSCCPNLSFEEKTF
jgi:hypothetical protein